MCLSKEIVGIHTCGQHGSQFSCIFARLDGSCKDNKVCFHFDLTVVKQVGTLYQKTSVRSLGYFSYLAFDVVYIKLFYRTAIELIEVFTRGTNINVEDMYIDIRIMVTHQHSLFCGVHTADLGAVALSSASHVTRTDTLDKYDILRMLAVGKTYYFTACRAGSIHQTLHLKGGNYVFALVVIIFVKLVQTDGIETSCHNDCAVLSGDYFIFLVVVYCTCCTDFGADTAFSGFEVDTVCSINNRYVRNCLCERCVDCSTVGQASVELAQVLLGRTFLLTESASGTFVHIYVSCFLTDVYFEITDESANALYLTVGIDVDLLMRVYLSHTRSQDTGRTVEGRECLVKL